MSRADELRRFASVTLTLALTDFKLRYYGNALGYFWTLAKPLMLFGVLYVAFTEIIDIGTIRNYPAVLLTGIVLYTYFSETTGEALSSLVNHESLVRKVPLPVLAIPCSVALRAFFTLCLNLIAVGVFYVLLGVEVTSGWLQLPLLLAGLLLLSTVTGALLANLYVPFRDIAAIWEIVLQAAFWGSAIIYPIESVPSEGLQQLIMMNPLAVIVVQARHALIDPSAPSAAEAAGGAVDLLIPAGIVALTLLAAIFTYRRVTPRLAEQL